MSHQYIEQSISVRQPAEDGLTASAAASIAYWARGLYCWLPQWHHVHRVQQLHADMESTLAVADLLLQEVLHAIHGHLGISPQLYGLWIPT
jgi:hypothetical protein